MKKLGAVWCEPGGASPLRMSGAASACCGIVAVSDIWLLLGGIESSEKHPTEAWSLGDNVVTHRGPVGLAEG